MKSETCFFLRSLQRKGLVRGIASRDGVSVHLLNENRTRLIWSGVCRSHTLIRGIHYFSEARLDGDRQRAAEAEMDRGWERERGSVTPVRGNQQRTVNKDAGQHTGTIMHTHTHLCTQRAKKQTQTTNAKHWQWQMLAGNWVGKETLSFLSALHLAFMVRMLRGKRWEERALACLSHGTLGSSRSIWWLLCLLLLYPQI